MKSDVDLWIRLFDLTELNNLLIVSPLEAASCIAPAQL